MPRSAAESFERSLGIIRLAAIPMNQSRQTVYLDYNATAPIARSHYEQVFKELPGLDAPPWPGELGQRIYDKVSGQAWKLWEERMKMILNEYRLMPWQKEAQELIAKQMEDFFFGEGAALPPGYVPQQAK